MKPFFRYYKHIVKTRLMQLAAYKADFFMTTLASFGYNFLAIVFINVLFDNFNTVANWSRYEGLFLLGYSQLVLYIYFIFFGSLDYFSTLIKEGKLDQFLVRPLNAFFTVVLDDPGIVQMIPSIVLALSICTVGFVNTSATLSMLLIIVVLFPISVLLFTAFKATTALLSFWFTDMTPVDQFYSQMVDNMKFPLDVYPKGIQMLLKTLIPVSLSVYAPVRFMYFGFDLSLFLYFIGAALLFSFATKILWQQGLKNYSSASS